MYVPQCVFRYQYVSICLHASLCFYMLKTPNKNYPTQIISQPKKKKQSLNPSIPHHINKKNPSHQPQSHKPHRRLPSQTTLNNNDIANHFVTKNCPPWHPTSNEKKKKNKNHLPSIKAAPRHCYPKIQIQH